MEGKKPTQGSMWLHLLITRDMTFLDHDLHAYTGVTTKGYVALSIISQGTDIEELKTKL